MALRDNPLQGLQSDPLLFESMVVRDLRVYAAALGGEVFHYRDNTGLEADAIVELPDGEWAAFEIRLGSAPAVTDPAAAALLKLRGSSGGLTRARRPRKVLSDSRAKW